MRQFLDSICFRNGDYLWGEMLKYKPNKAKNTKRQKNKAEDKREY